MNREMLEALRGIIKEEIQPLKDDIAGMKNDIAGMKNEITGIKQEITGIKQEVTGMKDEIKNISTRLERVESKTDKNTLILEDVNKNIQIIAEVQSSFQDQLGRAKIEDGKSLVERLETIELAVKDTSLGVRNVQQDLVRVVRATGENWAEIIELKSIK